MKKIAAVLLIGAATVFAEDYSTKSLEEMKVLRKTLSFWELPPFKAEMQKRMENMTPKEQQKLKDEMKTSK